MYEYRATVERVVDGDTVDLLIDLGFKIMYRHSCRLYGLNANESKTEAGVAAKAYLEALLPVGATVIVKTEKDRAEKYGRILGTLTIMRQKARSRTLLLEDTSVNAQLLAAGHAKPWDGSGARPV